MYIAPSSSPTSVWPSAASRISAYTQQTALSAPAAIIADRVQFSPAAQAQLAREQQNAASAPSPLDTDQGEQALDLDQYFSSTPTQNNGTLPPLLMPSQRNIDAITAHLNQTFPAFLAAHGITAAPASIDYDAYGQPQFPADYPNAAQLRQALQDDPGMARELATVKGLSEFNQLLNASQGFQQADSSAQSQEVRNAMIARHASLLSAQTRDSSTLLTFSATGILHIGRQST